MGLLDDAIREHLDLKRRRGADPVEVERAEREALGPVRRGPQDGDEEGFEEEQLGEPVAYDHEQEEMWEEPYDEELEPATGGAEELHERQAAADAPHPAADEEPFAEEELEPPAVPSPHPAEPRSGVGEPPVEETAEYDVEREEGDVEPGPRESAPESGEDEDVLEETPDFLQDAPDHDRLWFEQRPPRDFDFGG